jgi:hypothetical protein
MQCHRHRQTVEPVAEPLVEPVGIVEAAPAPELVWELPPELEPISAVANRNQPTAAGRCLARRTRAARTATTCRTPWPESYRARHQCRAQLAVRRQHRAARWRGVAVFRSGVPAALRHRRHGRADRIALRRRGGGCAGPARAGLVAAQTQQQLRVDAARHRDRGVVPDGVCGDASASAARSVRCAWACWSR